MSNKRLCALVLSLVSLRAANALAAERVAITPFSGVNVHPGYLQAAQELLRDHLAETKRFDVVALAGQPVGTDRPLAETLALGSTVGADVVAEGHITHVQSISRIRVSLYDVRSSALRYTDTLSSSGGPDEMDTLLKRLAQAAAHGEVARESAEIDTVTEQESQPYLKQTATRSVGLRLGAIAPISRPSGDSVATPGIGLSWLYDARSYMAELFLDYYGGSSADVRAFDLGLGVYHPFGRRDLSPYLGGALAYVVQDFGGQGANGLRLQGAAGFLLGRLSTVQLRAEVGYFVNAFVEKAHDGGSSALGHGPQVTVGIGF